MRTFSAALLAYVAAANHLTHTHADLAADIDKLEKDLAAQNAAFAIVDAKCDANSAAAVALGVDVTNIAGQLDPMLAQLFTDSAALKGLKTQLPYLREQYFKRQQDLFTDQITIATLQNKF